MKKLVFGLIATVMFSFSVGAQTKSTTNAVGKVNQTPKTVGWFSAGTFGCWGWSFCDGSAPWESIETTGSTTQILNSNDTMTFSIPISSLNVENVKFYSDKTTFELKNNSPLQVGECKLFGLKLGTEYLAGVYPLVNNGKSIIFTVKFK